MARWTVKGHAPVSLTTKDGQQVHVPLSDLYFDETGIQPGIWANHTVFGTLLTQQLGLLVGQGYLKRGTFLGDDPAKEAAKTAVDARRAPDEAKAKADSEDDAKPPTPKKAAEPKKAADKEATAATTAEEAPKKPDSPNVSDGGNQADPVIDEAHTEQAEAVP